jgi:hypothetical protein
MIGRVVIAAAAGAAVYWYGWVDRPDGPPSLTRFDADRVAELELAMWQAYYAKHKLRLFGLLVTLLREQHGYPRALAVRAAVHLARAAAIFGDARGGYERVLPDLERGFAVARDFTGAGFDPARVARLELAWWVARRDPAAADPENVGRRIAEMYAAYYGVPYATVAAAGRLRAEAGRLRDDGGAGADWPRVRELLRQAYRSLHAAL